MKQTFFRLFVLAFFAFTATSATFSHPLKKPVLPGAKNALRTLFADGNTKLSSIRSCKSMKTAQNDITVFDYLSAIIANQAKPKTTVSLEYGIKLVQGKRNSHFWQVELTFNNLDEESGDPWNPGFKFLKQMDNNQMIRGSLMCTGS